MLDVARASDISKGGWIASVESPKARATGTVRNDWLIVILQ